MGRRPAEGGSGVLIVGGHGYVGSRVADVATRSGSGTPAEVVSRDGSTRWGRPSLPWDDLAAVLTAQEPQSVVWLLDGAKHAELDRLRELLQWAPPDTHVVLVSTCTVYGDQAGAPCDERQALDLRTPHARLKAQAEAVLADSSLTWCVQRLGALYGVDDRGARRDRVEKWVTAAATTGKVLVPDPTHWRGWVHRDQAARSLWRAARDRISGVFNVSSADLTFGEAAELAAAPFRARVVADTEADLCNYRVDATKARSQGLLDELPGEDLPTCVATFTRDRYPHPDATFN